MVPGDRGENGEQGHEHGEVEVERDGGVAGFAGYGVEQKAEESEETELGEDGGEALEGSEGAEDGEQGKVGLVVAVVILHEADDAEVVERVVPAHEGKAEEQEGGGGEGSGPEGFSAAEQKIDEQESREELESGGEAEREAGSEVALLAEVVPGEGHQEGEDHADLAIAEDHPEGVPAEKSEEKNGRQAGGELKASSEKPDCSGQGCDGKESEEQLNEADVKPGDEQG